MLDTRLDLRSPWSAAFLTGTEEEGERIARWMRQDYLVRTWNRVWSPKRWTEHLRKSGEAEHTRPFLVKFDDRPFAYVEVYLLNSSVLAAHGDWTAHDLGFHLAVIDPELTRRGLGTRFVRELTATLFRQSPATSQIVTEPDIENVPIRKTLERSGYHLVTTARLADKVAAIMRCPRTPQDTVVSSHRSSGVGDSAPLDAMSRHTGDG